MNSYDCVAFYLASLGWAVLEKPNIEDNYFDLTAVSKKKTLRVEIKTLMTKDNGCWQASAISDNQKRADAVAIVFPNKSVFIEKMEDYLQHCSDSGYRQFTWLRP
jgi:heterodisulfide reductase subunit B